MRARIDRIREVLAASLWFMPTLLVAAACGLAALTLLADERAPDLGGSRPWLFAGHASAARDLLATVAGSLITVVALAFSVTIVAIQQAATQFSPRVIRNFMRDRGNQLVFGTYIATFVYALLILRQVRAAEEGGGAFVPALSITAALLLALLCVALLIYFIHHTATSLQVATIADNIRRELREGIDRLYPDRLAAPALAADRRAPPTAPTGAPEHVVRAPRAGFLLSVDGDRLLGALPPAATLARARPLVGDYLIEGAPLLELWGGGSPAPDERDALAGAFLLGRERSTAQDLRFGIRQLVDIALKALSPGINDPTTAEQCLAHLGDVVAQLADRRFPEPWRRARDREVPLLLARADFADLVGAAFDQIRREAAGDVHVTGTLLAVLAQIAPRAAPERAAPLRRQVLDILEALDGQAFVERDTALLRERARRALDALPG